MGRIRLIKRLAEQERVKAARRFARSRTGRAAIALGVTSALIAGAAATGVVSRSIEGTPTSALSNLSLTGGVQITGTRDGLRPDAPEPTITVTLTDNGPSDLLAAQAVSDVLEFWEQTALPKGAGHLDPPTAFWSYDSTAGRGVSCGEQYVTEANAFYCTSTRAVAWDRGDLVPTLSEMFGELAVAASLAHEIGHAVQNMDGVRGSNVTLVREHQADCFAGSWAAWVAEGNSRRFTMTRTGLHDVLMALVVLMSDPVDVTATEGLPNAHGDGMERVWAFQEGWMRGVDSCMGITERSVRENRAGLPLTWDAEEAASGGELVFTDQNVGDLKALVQESLGKDAESLFSAAAMNEIAGQQRVPGIRGDGTALLELFYEMAETWSLANMDVVRADTEAPRWCAVGAVTRAFTQPGRGYSISAGDLGEMAFGILNLSKDAGVDPFVAFQSFRKGLTAKALTECRGERPPMP